MSSIIGRDKEKDLLDRLYNRVDSDFLAVYGRRRVGKTYLIRNYFCDLPCIYFEITGLKDGSLRNQLKLFTEKLRSLFPTINLSIEPKNWLDAFRLLTESIDEISKKETIVLFFDELPWLSTRKSGFIQALDHYWNTKWSIRKKLKLIVCGSAASWMIDNLIRAKGGLHNRLTALIALKPFSLHEVELYLTNRNIKLNQHQILELYMIVGGIPHYLNQIQKGISPTQNINKICFSKKGFLFDEFNNLFTSLFDHSEAHMELIRLIAHYRSGVDKNTLLNNTKHSTSGGAFKDRLVELEEAGFIAEFTPFGRKKKGSFYRIIDEYTLFYLHWIEPAAKKLKLSLLTSNYWESKTQTQSWKTWGGYAFEALCFKHIEQIKKALGIHSIASDIASLRYVSTDKSQEGAQIDLLIDRADGIVNLCEIKYCSGGFKITKSEAKNLEHKIYIYKTFASSNKTVFLTMISPDGVVKNEYYDQLVSNEIQLSDLFRPGE